MRRPYQTDQVPLPGHLISKVSLRYVSPNKVTNGSSAFYHFSGDCVGIDPNEDLGSYNFHMVGRMRLLATAGTQPPAPPEALTNAHAVPLPCLLHPALNCRRRLHLVSYQSFLSFSLSLSLSLFLCFYFSLSPSLARSLSRISLLEKSVGAVFVALTPAQPPGNSNPHSSRPVPLIITMIKWIRTNRLSKNNFLSLSR